MPKESIASTVPRNARELGLVATLQEYVARSRRLLAQAATICGTKPKHAYCDLGYRGHDYKGDVDIQVVNRFRRRKPRALLRWWMRRCAIEPVIGHVKSDHGTDRNMLIGTRFSNDTRGNRRSGRRNRRANDRRSVRTR